MMRRLCACVLAAVAFLTAWPALAQEKLAVWWVRGAYKAEDDALQEAIRRFEAKTGVKVELSQYAAQDMIPKTVAALEAGNAPDVAYADAYDAQQTARWAHEGKLEDLGDVITPIRERFLGNTIEATHLYNEKTRKRAYYAFPLRQQTLQLAYWKDMLDEAGFREAAIPGGWKAYWDFWCDKVQPAYRRKTGKRAYAVGQPMGVDSSDSYRGFLTFADAYNVKLVDDNGNLRVDDPGVRRGLVSALRDYVAFRERDCTPPASTAWRDPDNNTAFDDRTIVLTHNVGMALAAKWLDEAGNAALPAEQRAQAARNYDERIVTTGFPNKPDGSKMVYRAAVKTGVVFEAARNKRRAKEFVRFMLEDENLRPYVEASRGRWFPVTKSGAQSAFWQADPHRRAVHRQFEAGTLNYEYTRNSRFTILNNENVWAKAMSRVVNDGVSVEKAVDELIARIRQVAG